MYPESHTHTARTKKDSQGLIAKFRVTTAVPAGTLCRRLDSGIWVTYDPDFIASKPTEFVDTLSYGVEVSEDNLVDITEVIQI